MHPTLPTLALAVAALTPGATATCTSTVTLDFILLDGDATAAALENDITTDLAKVGITVNARYFAALRACGPS